MRTAMEEQVKAIDFSKYAEMSLAIFLFIGFIITLLVQSSSVTMALTLSAIHAGAISFPAAAALTLGSETGTIFKIILGTIGGTAAKKRVVLGNLIFNIFLTVLAFLFLEDILALITNVFKIHDPLIGLVTFSTFVNLSSLIIFLPFLNLFTRFLEKFFKNTDASLAAFINHANINEPETALDLFRKETEYFIYNVILFNLTVFDIDQDSFREHSEFKDINLKKNVFSKNSGEKYTFIKQLQGELQAFYVELRSKVTAGQHAQLDQLISAIRSAMYSVKSIKDISSNVNNLKRSSKDIKFDFFLSHKKETEALYNELNEFFREQEKFTSEKFKDIFNNITANYNNSLNTFYREVENSNLEDLDISTALNFNRELFTSNKALLNALKDLLLEEKDVELFDKQFTY